MLLQDLLGDPRVERLGGEGRARGGGVAVQHLGHAREDRALCVVRARNVRVRAGCASAGDACMCVRACDTRVRALVVDAGDM